MMKGEHAAERNKLINKIKRIFSIIFQGYFGGAYDKVLKYIEKEEQLIKRFQGDVPGEIKRLHILWLWYRVNIYAYRGDLVRSFKYANELLMVGQLYEHKRGISEGTFAVAAKLKLAMVFSSDNLLMVSAEARTAS